MLPWYNDVLSDSVKNLTIANLEKKGASGDWDYASPSDSVILFLNEGNTFSESYIAYAIAERLGEARNSALASNRESAGK